MDFEIDKNLNATICAECPSCKKKHKKNTKDVAPNSSIKCPCGQTIVFTGDDLRKVQKALDDLKRSLKNLGK